MITITTLQRLFLPLLIAFTFTLPVVHAKNVILFIGDGMGPSTVTAARILKKQQGGKFSMDQFEHTATVSTSSLDQVVTDSAAAATALATGVKVKNDALSYRDDFPKKDLKTIAEMAQDKQYSVGILTTTSITHATPAAFYAHVSHRADERKIGEQLLQTRFQVFLGGGAQFFSPQMLQQQNRFQVYEDFRILESQLSKQEKPVLGIFQPNHMSYMQDRKPGTHEPTLSQMTQAALTLLVKNKNGFFLMVEGGRIDHALHENSALKALEETIEFDNAIGQTLSWLHQNPTLHANTLVIVTADHDTGGLAINGYFPPSQSILSNLGAGLPILTFSTGPAQEGPRKLSSAAHTAVDVLAYATGPNSEKVQGTLENTKIFEIMSDALGKPATRISQNLTFDQSRKK